MVPSRGTEDRKPIIAIVTDAIHPYSLGGREIRYHELSRYLVASADVNIYTMKWWNGPATRTEADVTFHAITGLLPFYRHGRRSVRQALRFALASLRLLWRPFDVLNVDHIPQFQLFTLRLVTWIRRKPLIATWHEVWGPEYWREYMGGIGGRIAWGIELMSMRMPDHVIAASHQTGQRLTELVPGLPVSISPNGIDLDGVNAAIPDPATTDLVIVTRLMAHKRIDMLLEAMALLRAEGRPVTCRIIGTGPEQESLHRIAHELGVADLVDFRHDVREQKEVYSLLKAGRVFPFPSNREGFGIAVLEALACGLHVITTTAPDNLAQHLVARAEHGTLCDHNARAFADAIDAALDRGKGGSAEPWLVEYSWPAIAGGILEVLLP
ncbi:glycosyltransferase family 4 protein [Actinocorallia longicatena]|uniref:Glycosyltransferase family 4 protein n=1 Tax=Actinocorallia longicatena TaxID=111803 RepID=A0ABP6QK56_9ACTN